MNEELPEGLLAALDVYQSDPEWFPPQGTPGLRAMVKVGGSPTKADFEWVESRQPLIDEANEVWAEITRLAPMPTRDELLDTNEVVYPDWVGTIWQRTLQYPWSQDFEEALAEAKAYLEQTATAKA